MIIHELCEFYDILKNDPQCNIPTIGYSTTKVSAVIVISNEGEFLDIVSLLQEDRKGKNTIPRMMNVPSQTARSGKNPPAYFMCDNMKYTLGIDKDKNVCQKQFEMFSELQKNILSQASEYRAKAILAFLNKFNILEISPIIESNFDILLADRNLVFRIDGEAEFLHENKEIRECWEQYISTSSDDVIAQCMITGKATAISRLHTPLKNIRNSQSSGASLVSFNDTAYESYNKKQSFNAPVGKKSEFAYATTLNYLLANSDYKIQIGDATTVFWAQSSNKVYNDMIAELFSPTEISNDDKEDNSQNNIQDKNTKGLIKDILTKTKEGQVITKLPSDIDTNTKFCVLGLSPNAARVSVRFFYRNTFGDFLDKLLKHYLEMEMVKQFNNEFTNIPIWKILKETVSPKSNDKEPKPLLAGAFMKAMLNGGMYPDMLYQAILLRIKADNEIRVNYIRASVLKLCLLRKSRINNNKNLEEVLTVALNEETKNTGYLLGRLFAVLEKLQYDASGGVNSSIKDKYFTSACTTPKSVFPVLIRLSQHHISKAEYGKMLDKQVEKVMQDITDFPAHLSLDEQGLFSIGYYQQRVKLWEKQNKNTEVE